MNFRFVFRVIGQIMRFEAVAMVPPLLIAIYHREGDEMAFALTIGFLLLLGTILANLEQTSKQIKVKEALTVVTFGWVVAAFFGAMPFLISGAIPNFTDAFFEAVSGLTTTGATIIDDIEILPRGILFWRSFMHWIGGMGILVLALAIMPTVGVGAFQLFKAESPGPISDKVAPRLRDTAKILYTAYLGITVLQVTLLFLGGMSFYESLIHTFGTVGTGGFSTRNASIGAFTSPYILTVITFFMIASGVNFSLYYELYKGRFKNLYTNIEFRVYLSIILIAGLLITWNIRGHYDSIFQSAQHAFFQVSSIITTTGYGTANFDLWPSFSKAILFSLMFVGGSAGSTGGSIKVVRLIILFKLMKREVSKLLHPRAMIPVQFNGKILQSDVIAGVTGFFFLYMLLMAGSTVLLSLENISLLSAASAVAASLGNIGPGFELVGPANTYSFFSAPSKWLLSLLMLFGRLELFTILVLLTPSHWRNN